MISARQPGLASRHAAPGHIAVHFVIAELVRVGLLIVAAGLAIGVGLPLLLALAAAS